MIYKIGRCAKLKSIVRIALSESTCKIHFAITLKPYWHGLSYVELLLLFFIIGLLLFFWVILPHRDLLLSHRVLLYLQLNCFNSHCRQFDNVCSRSNDSMPLGAVHKVRHAREGGWPRRCESLWQEGGVKSMWRHAYKFFYYTYET